jgi:hypothetical protein
VSCACTLELRSACSTVPSAIVVPVVVLVRRTTTPATRASETTSAISALIVVNAGRPVSITRSVLSLPSGIVSPGCQFETVVRSGRVGTTAGATLENGEDHLFLERGSVWFRWKAPWSGWATFHPCGSRFDTELDVYTGPSLLELEEVYLRADACARGDAWHADFEAAAGTVYRIAVGAAYRGNKGPFTLRWGRYPERTSARGSCFFSTKGVLRWCLGRGANSWDPCSASTVYKDRRSRYWVEEGHTVWGYVRTAGPGRWRAMVGPGPQGWSRDGTIVRAAGGRWIVRNFRGRSLGFARGPHPVAVGAYRLLAGNC